MLWEREEQEQDLSTPEQRAAFETRLKAMVAKIGDATVKTHYERELRETLWTFNRTVVREIARGEGPRRSARPAPGATISRPTGACASAPGSARAASGCRPQHAARGSASAELSQRSELTPPREALLVKTLLNHPWLIDEHAEEIAALTLRLGAGGAAARCHSGGPCRRKCT